MAGLERSGLLEILVRIEPRPAAEQWLAQIHTSAYLKELEEATQQAPRQLDPDTRVSPDSYRVAKLATGGVLTAVDAVVTGKISNAFAVIRPPGHHALPDRAMGFCLLNHVAIAARYIQKKHGLRRILIVDWDVHHGNGTQDVFYDDPSVLYFSAHQFPYYPGSGSAEEQGTGAGLGTTVNVPLPSGSGDAEILKAFREKLIPAAEAFRPDFVLISSGFDAHEQDPLAQLRITTPGFAAMTQIVAGIAERHAKGRLVSLLEGGYDLKALAQATEAHLRVLMNHPIAGPPAD
jgi:acetoin utilization deacetylase AcuC-like enzyme